MLDSILTDLEQHCARCVTRLDDITVTRERLRKEEKQLRRELKAGQAIFVSAKKTIDRAVAKHTERRPVGRPRLVKAS